MTETGIQSETRAGSASYKWELLALLWIAFFLHQGDRQIYNSIVKQIRDGLQLDDLQMGFVGTAFNLVYGLLVPVAGILGDRLPRKWIIVGSLLVFSLGTLLTGLAHGVIALIVFRGLATGGGEAFFYPAATSLLAQLHDRTRALALGILQTALYIGVSTSAWLAGAIQEQFGWRWAFVVFGSGGLLWAIIVSWRLRNTPKSPPPPGTPANVPLMEALPYIARRPSVWLLTAAFAMMVYVNVGFTMWMSTHLQDEFRLAPGVAGLHSMVWHFSFAFVGVLAGSRLADWMVRRRPSIRMEANFIGLLLGAPFIYWLGQAQTLAATCVALALFGLFRGIYDSNLFASLFDVVEPRVRASATGLMLAVAFVVGSNSSTILAIQKKAYGLRMGLSSLSLFYLAGAACIFVAARFFLKRDYVPPAENDLKGSG